MHTKELPYFDAKLLILQKILVGELKLLRLKFKFLLKIAVTDNPTKF